MSTMKIVGIWLILTLLSAVVHAGTKHYYYTDAQETVLAKADAQGNIIASYDYAPYGTQVLGTPPSGPAGYTGHVNDPDTGLVYMQARYYDPAMGRFLSVDPQNPEQGEVFNFNRYDYANNNPAINVDPDGRGSKFAWIVKFTADGMRQVARVSLEHAASIARSGKGNILAGTEQGAHKIANAAGRGKGVVKDAGHELKGKGGIRGLPHYHTADRNGSHIFWGKIAVVATAAAETLDKAADAAEYIPDPAPRLATTEDLKRTNAIIQTINNVTGLSFPKVDTQVKPLNFDYPNKNDDK